MSIFVGLVWHRSTAMKLKETNVGGAGGQPPLVTSVLLLGNAAPTCIKYSIDKEKTHVCGVPSLCI